MLLLRLYCETVIRSSGEKSVKFHEDHSLVFLRQNLDVTIDNTSFNSLYQVTADGVENVGCDDFLHCFVGFGFGEVFFGVGDGDDFAAACSVFKDEL